MDTHEYIQHYTRLGLTPIPLEHRSKKPLVKWTKGWNPNLNELESWASNPTINWGVRCGENLAVIDCDSEDIYQDFIATHELPKNCPIVKTARGYHIWLRPKKAIRSQNIGNFELKCLGSYIVAPPSIHPSGVPYVFQVAPNGAIPEVDLDILFNLQSEVTEPVKANQKDLNTPSDFAIRYGKSPYPQSLCGRATKVLTRSDGNVKKLLSLRCWKWHCLKCAPLLQRYWLDKLGRIQFRFIIQLHTLDKPTAFLRRIGKPAYVHIVANADSWLFLINGETKKVWGQINSAEYELIASDAAGYLTMEKVSECLERALCLEQKPLNTRRKVTHSRGLFSKESVNNHGDESKRKADPLEENKGVVNATFGKKSAKWDSKMFMKTNHELAKELDEEGWQIFWRSEVEAIAFKGDVSQNKDILELFDTLGVKLKKVGSEYTGLCPFHEDTNPSLFVNSEKGVWHCFGCGRGGGINALVKEMSAR
jgi:hypothetical protein